MMTQEDKDLAEYISENYKSPIEIGVGHRPEVAEEISRLGLPVRTSDIYPREAPGFILDDVTRPQIELYQGADLIYSIRPPEELWADLARLAYTIGADLIIRPLTGEAADIARYFKQVEAKSHGAARFLLFRN